MNGATPTTATQTLRGFYDAPNSGAARLSLLVGTGAKNATDQVFLGTSNVPVATNPFFTRDSNSPGSDRAWDSPTWAVTMPATPTYGTTLINGLTRTYGEQVDVRITHTVATPYDCIATSAMVLSTEVPDLDFDGLLDVWETGNVDGPSPSNPALPLIDPGTNQPLPISGPWEHQRPSRTSSSSWGI